MILRNVHTRRRQGFARCQEMPLPLEEFTARMEKRVKPHQIDARRASADEVSVAGDPERRPEADRLKNDIPIDEGNLERSLRRRRAVGACDRPPGPF